MSEELALEEMFRNRRTIHRDQRRAAPDAPGVDGARHQLFPRAALPGDQDAARSRGGIPDLLAHGRHGDTVADQIAKRRLGRILLPNAWLITHNRPARRHGALREDDSGGSETTPARQRAECPGSPTPRQEAKRRRWENRSPIGAGRTLPAAVESRACADARASCSRKPLWAGYAAWKKIYAELAADFGAVTPKREVLDVIGIERLLAVERATVEKGRPPGAA